MSKTPRVVSASGDAVMQTLAWARKAGFRPVPLRPRSKAATSQNYVALDYEPPPDGLWREREYGVGVVTGPRHHGPVDADLDCPEAVFFAEHFLPPTDAVFGRASKERSHRLYRVDAAAFEKLAYLDPRDGTTIIEIRGDAGHQTVMPGSLHEDTGELIEWSGVPFPEVPIVATDVLSRAVRKVALATLIARHVWQPGYHNEPCKLLAGVFFYLEWPLDEAEQFIQALMGYSGDGDKSRLPTVRATYRRGEAGKKVAGAGVLRKQLNDDGLVDRILDWAGSPAINLLNEYNERFGVVCLGGKFRVADVRVEPSRRPSFFPKEDFLLWMGTDLSDIVDDKGRRVPKARAWLASPRRRHYERVGFMPGQEDDDGRTLNLWTGWAVQPEPEQEEPVAAGTEAASRCGAWLELLAYIVCGEDPELYRWMIHWFANIVREPMNKPGTAPVIIGEQGAGKSLLFDYFGRILGECYVPVTCAEHIFGKFNSHLSTALLLHSEEALYGGDKRHRASVKSMITDKLSMLEKKGVDVERISSHLRLAFTSNEEHAAPVEASERRFTIINMKDRMIPRELIKRVLAERDGGGPAALHRFLLDMDYDPELPRTNIKNCDLEDIKDLNMEPLPEWWYGVLRAGVMLPDYLMWAQDNPSDEETVDWPRTVGKQALYLAYVFKMRERAARNVLSDIAFGMHLSKFLGRTHVPAKRIYDNPQLDGVPMEVRMLSGRQNVYTNIPSLDECRAAFEKYRKHEIRWPKDDAPRPIKKDHEKF